MIAPGLRIVAALRSGALLVHRPRGVVHVATGPVTASGRFLSSHGRIVCRARTRRLHVLDRPGGTVELGGRRFCRRCTATLAPSLGVAERQPVSREDWVAAYSHLTVADLAQAARWTQDVEETHQVGRILLMVHGPAPIRRPAEGTAAAERWALEQEIHARRTHLTLRSLTPEQHAEIEAAKQDAAIDRRRIESQRRRDHARDRALDRANRGQYRTTWEREHLKAG